jgi:RNA polymerase sigma-70 factor (ECF subfamily)
VSSLRVLDGELNEAARASRADLTEALVERARSGDTGAFEELVRITSPSCYALALRLVGNEHDARDVMQDAYLRAFRGLRRFRGEAGFSTWLHRITVNCAASLLKRRQNASCDLLDDFGDTAQLIEQRSDGNPESAASTAVDRERLVEALSELPDQLRLVVVLRDVYDLSHRDIAKELGISQAAAKVRLHRARRRLRERLFPARRADMAETAADVSGDALTLEVTQLTVEVAQRETPALLESPSPLERRPLEHSA